MTEIKFGTDGWRAVIDEDFIPENISKVAQAFADLYPNMPEAGRPVAIGYDRRKNSPEAAKNVASVLAGNGINVILSETYCPTPAVSWYVKHKGCAAGIMITASHNPPQWNGIKFKESYGGAASGEYCRPIEKIIKANDASNKQPRKASIDSNPIISTFNAYDDYMNSFSNFIDMKKIKQSGFKIVFDPLYGSGSGYMTRLLGDMVYEIHGNEDINFGGLNPEPIPPHANELMKTVKDGDFSCGLLTDGDADRAGAADENGNFVTTHELYSLLITHAVEDKNWRGKIIKSISTTKMIDRLAAKYGLKMKTTPVGFKYISPAMKDSSVMVGGEESGGFGFPKHIPERDGTFSNLMILEMMADRKSSLGELVSALQKDVGPCKYKRIDFHLTADAIAEARRGMESLNITSIGSRKLVHHETMDGHHFLFDDDSWLLFRASGTEPLVRIYAEAGTMEQVEEMLAFGKKTLNI